MPTDKLDVKNLFIVDLNTGKEIEFKYAGEVTSTKEDKTEHEPILSLTESKGFTATMEINEISKRMINMLAGRKIFKGSIEEILQQFKKVFTLNWTLKHNISQADIKQTRTHKKARINKKWAKRYGYTMTVWYE